MTSYLLRTIQGLLLFASVFLTLAGCSTASKQEQHHPITKDNTDSVPPPALLTEDFAQFMKSFPNRALPQAYNADWIEKFQKEGRLKEISSKLCGDYIYNQSVIGTSGNSFALPSEADYYYAYHIPTRQEYIPLVFVSFSGEYTQAYLCTYLRDGTFAGGVLLYEQVNGEMRQKGLLQMKNQRLSITASGILNQQYTVQPQGKVVSN